MSTTTSNSNSDSSSTVENADHSYIREDGKRVQLVPISSVGSATSDAASSRNDIYIRADGKKVRRVKRGTNSADKDVPAFGSGVEMVPSTGSPILPLQPLLPGDPPQERSIHHMIKTPLISNDDSKSWNPIKEQESTQERQSSASEINHIVADTSVIAASLNKIDDRTNEQGVVSEKNPWLSLPSFEESVKSSEKSQHERARSPSSHLFGSLHEGQNDNNLHLAPIIAASAIDVPIATHAEIDTQPPAPADTLHGYNISPARSCQENNDDNLVNALTKIVAAVSAAHDTPIRGSTSRGIAIPSDTTSERHFIKIPSVIDTPIISDYPLPSQVSNRAFHQESVVATSGDESRHSSEFQNGDAEQQTLRNTHSSKFRLPESIAVKTRSRADVDNLDGLESLGSYDRMSRMYQITDADAAVFNATLAHKRVKVVQLLFFGLIGILGFLGSFYVQSGCNFFNAYVEVDSQVFVLHYGLWKYTPIDSAFQGYTFCADYDDEFTSDAPIIPRIAGITGLVTGSYSLFILWFYLIMGIASYKFWITGIVFAAVSCLCQGLAFTFFAGDVCERNTCRLGPGGWVGIASTTAWLLLSFEMYYNMPISVMMTHLSPGVMGASVMSHLELSDFSRGMHAYVQRVSSGSIVEPLPTLNEYQRRRDGPGSVGKGMMELNSIKRSGSYKPPAFD